MSNESWMSLHLLDIQTQKLPTWKETHTTGVLLTSYPFGGELRGKILPSLRDTCHKRQCLLARAYAPSIPPLLQKQGS
jgi:hypothetical protein